MDQVSTQLKIAAVDQAIKFAATKEEDSKPEDVLQFARDLYNFYKEQPKVKV